MSLKKKATEIFDQILKMENNFVSCINGNENYFIYAYQLQPLLPIKCLLCFNLCIEVRKPNHLSTTILLLWPPHLHSFETILNQKIWKHFRSSNLIFDHSRASVKGPQLVNFFLLSYSDNWSSTLRHFDKSIVVTLDILKTFERVCHKILFSNSG